MNHYEDAEQKALMEWAALRNCEGLPMTQFLIAIPNGGYRHPREAKRMKSLGVKPGVSDLYLALPRCGFHGLWVEMKKQIQHFASRAEVMRALNPEQAQWQASMRVRGYGAAVCYGAGEAIELLTFYASERRHDFLRTYDFLLNRFQRVAA